MKIKEILSVVGLLGTMGFMSGAQAVGVNSDMKVSAKVIAGCFISSNNIDFGVLQMPLVNSSASADIDMICSKNASVKLEIIHAQTQAYLANYKQETTGYGDHHTYYRVKDGSRVIGMISCSNDGGNKMYLETAELRQLYGYNSTVYDRNWVTDTIGVCIGNNLNVSKFNSLQVQKKTGLLTGVKSGEKIVFSLQHPTNTSLVWGEGTNAYSTRATGETQKISMKANIKTADNPTHRMTPDNYLDSLTVVLTY